MAVLLWADALWDALVPVGFVVFWIIASVLRGISETKSAAPRKAPQAPAPAAAQRPRQDPRQELEKFLNEMASTKTRSKPADQGARRAVAPAAASPPPRNPRSRVARPPQPQTPLPPSVPVSQRHLESSITGRRPDVVQSALADKHVEVRVGTTSIAPPEPRPAETAKRAPPDVALRALFADKDQLARAFILGTVFGAPRAFDDR